MAYALGSSCADLGKAHTVRQRFSDDQIGNLENKNAKRESRGRGPGKSPCTLFAVKKVRNSLSYSSKVGQFYFGERLTAKWVKIRPALTWSRTSDHCAMREALALSQLPFLPLYGNVDHRRSRWELSFGQSYRVTPNIIFGKAPEVHLHLTSLIRPAKRVST